MDVIYRDFRVAHMNCSGPLLATTITPVAPLEDPNRLVRFYESSSSFAVATDVRSCLFAHPDTELRLAKSEDNAWVDVYVTYWKATGRILAVDDGEKGGWSQLYESWKEVTNALIRGYSNSGFEAWTIPCLYVTARYLRAFAIRADEEQSVGNGVSFVIGMHDDMVGDHGKNEKLEDAARIINRIFTLCISDRYVGLLKAQFSVDSILRICARAPLESSRKWGLYYTTNLLFKTYFKVNTSTPGMIQSS